MLLNIENLKTHFYTERGLVTAIEGVSFQIKPGEIVGLVGESGSGKSVTSQSILKLFDNNLTDYEGKIEFEGKSILELNEKMMQRIRGDEISMIFQDPLSSLNPVFTIGEQIREAIIFHQNKSKKEADKIAIELLKITGIPLPEKRVNEYPHQLSGGMRQRAMIAIALACQPKLLIADEPTTALDVTIQAQILKLLKNLNQTNNMAIIFITHDLGVVSELCNRVLVMYLGQIVEESDVESLFKEPLHPYTKGLINSIPKLDSNRNVDLHIIPGTVPSLTNKPKGCRFSNRCPFVSEICQNEQPELKIYADDRKVRCWHVNEIIEKGEKIND